MTRAIAIIGAIVLVYLALAAFDGTVHSNEVYQEALFK